MNANADNHEPTKHESLSVDELHDRLLDRGLAEVVGGETPPDLSGLILADKRPVLAAAEDSSAGSRRSVRFWAAVAVAATLLVGTVGLFLQSGASFSPRMAFNTPPNAKELARVDRG